MNILGVASSLFITCVACGVNEVFFSKESELKIFTNRILFIVALSEVLKITLELLVMLRGYVSSVI